ncbi:MAG: MmcB family DNA repair protein [Chloroflexi bacterium]|nr:MmcB family DNA repair protein [Chloroflexota bacterium]
MAECKGGPTWTAVPDRLDAWAMRRSWTRPMIWGYEIKIARGDWIKDTKWRNYLQYCQEFYFVCPPHIIERDELPEEAGLIWTSKTGSRLYTKKRAPTRDVTVPQELWMYLLMWRAEIGSEYPSRTSSDRDYWQKWLVQKRENRELGYRVRGELRKTVSERVDMMDCENRRLRAENKKLGEVRETLKTLGLSTYDTATAIERRNKELMTALPHGLKWSMDELERGLELFREELGKLAGG